MLRLVLSLAALLTEVPIPGCSGDGETATPAPAGVSEPRSSPPSAGRASRTEPASSTPDNAAPQGPESDHWCYLRGVAADVNVAGCFPDEASCKRIFTRADTYDLIEECHFRSPVYCYDVIDGARVRPQCFARMDACAGHWKVTKDHGCMAGGEAGPGCFQRKAPGTGA